MSPASVPLYRRLLGADFDRLPPAVRSLHDVRERSVWIGRADVERGTSFVCRLIAAIAGLPPAGPDQPLTVTFTPENGAEIWHRAFGARVFRTVQALGPGVILEQSGPARLTLAPRLTAAGLSLDIQAAHVLGIAVPGWLLPIANTCEYDSDGRYHFEVEARLPWFGRLVRYAGWLEPAAKQQVAARTGDCPHPFGREALPNPPPFDDQASLEASRNWYAARDLIG